MFIDMIARVPSVGIPHLGNPQDSRPQTSHSVPQHAPTPSPVRVLKGDGAGSDSARRLRRPCYLDGEWWKRGLSNPSALQPLELIDGLVELTLVHRLVALDVLDFLFARQPDGLTLRAQCRLTSALHGLQQRLQSRLFRL